MLDNNLKTDPLYPPMVDSGGKANTLFICYNFVFRPDFSGNTVAASNPNVIRFNHLSSFFRNAELPKGLLICSYLCRYSIASM